MVTKKVIGLLFFLVDAAIAFSIGSHRNKALALQFTTQPSQLYASPQAQETPTQLDTPIALGSYTHKNRKLTYLFKEAAPGRENEPPIILIHPVGVGISSWFWMRLMEAYEDNPAIYAPDLIGCGLNHGADPWDPEKGGLFFPLSWVEGVETLIQTIALPRWKQSFNWMGLGGNSNNKGCLVIAQGGLAPVGVMLASRNPRTVGNLILTSPPVYTDMVTAVPQKELEKNYNFLRSPIFGNIAFALLESRSIIRFFSDLFLFQEKCDEEWLDQTQKEVFREARPPIEAFNAGLLQHRSFEEEMRFLPQPTKILSGEGDKRAIDRVLYGTEMNQCVLETIEGCNVLPWENPKGVVDQIKEMR